MLMSSGGAPRSLVMVRSMQRPRSELLKKVDGGVGAHAAAVGVRKTRERGTRVKVKKDPPCLFIREMVNSKMVGAEIKEA